MRTLPPEWLTASTRTPDTQLDLCLAALKQMLPRWVQEVLTELAAAPALWVCGVEALVNEGGDAVV